MVILTALVSLDRSSAHRGNINKQVKGYFALFLLLETGMMGTVLLHRLFPLLRFLGVDAAGRCISSSAFGAARAQRVRRDQILPLHAGVGSVLMLLAIIALYYNSAPTVLANGVPAKHSFDIMKLAYLNGGFTHVALTARRRVHAHHLDRSVHWIRDQDSDVPVSQLGCPTRTSKRRRQFRSFPRRCAS